MNPTSVAKRVLRPALGLNAIAVGKLLSGGPRAFVQACEQSFRVVRDSAPSPFEIPVIQLDEILGDRHPRIEMAVTRREDGTLPFDQLVTLLAIVVAEQPKAVLEIGTFMGHTTRHIAEAVDTVVVHTVDLPQDASAGSMSAGTIPKDDFHLISRRVVGREFRGLACGSRIRQHFADTATWDFRNAESANLFFIDGSHTYEYAKNDSEKCYALCGGRGVFLWHDCDPTHPGVMRALTEWRQLGRDVRRIAGTTIAYWKSVA